MWDLAAGAYLAWVIARRRRKRARWLGEEPDTPDGQHRARERDAVRRGLEVALPSLFTGRNAGLFIDDLQRERWMGREVGWRAQVRTTGALTVTQIRATSGQVFARDNDGLASAVNDALHQSWPTRKLGPAPQLVGSHVEGGEHAGKATLRFLTFDPFAEPIAVPYGIDDHVVGDPSLGVPVGARIGARTARLRLWGRHLEVQGQNGWGKSSLVHALFFALATVEHVAFVVSDCKGLDGPLWAARASGVTTSPGGSAAFARCLRLEMERRLAALGDDGEQKLARPTAKFPWIVASFDEVPDAVTGEGFEADLLQLVRKSRAVGISVIVSGQLIKAGTLDTETTTQLVKVSAYQPTLSAAGVAIGQHRATKSFGPHLIPDNQQRYAGVIAGSFGAGDEYIRAFYVPGALARKRAERTSSRRVELPWLKEEDKPMPRTDPPRSDWHAFEGRPLVVADLPHAIVGRLEALAGVTEKALADEYATKAALWKTVVNPAMKRANDDRDAPGWTFDDVREWSAEVDAYITKGLVPTH